MKELQIKTSTLEYNIFVGKNITNKLETYTKNYDKVLLLTNNTLDELYGEKIFDELPKEKTFKFVIEDGEIHKNMNVAMEIFSFLIENNFSRKSLIICMGGGVVCDLGGFIASLFMRGIDFLQLPTSLLSQVDASIGGKVAVNHPLGKNLIGAFKQPIGVIIDIKFLDTLPEEQFKSGMGEVIKHSLLTKEKTYFKFLENNSDKILKLDSETIIEMIYESCKIKQEFVERDEFENGDRAFLNLGHTYGHALETLYTYENISHGEAVSRGIIFAAEISKKLGFITDEYIESIKNIFNIYEMTYSPIYITPDKLIELIKIDKKNSNNEIKFIIDKNGSFEVISVSEDVILNVNKSFKNRFLKGIIDIGSNSCRLLIAEVEKSENTIKIIKTLHKDLEVSRLGKNLIKTGELSKESIDKTCEIIKKFKSKATSMGIEQITAFATSATREATNGNLLIQTLKNETDVDTVIITGEIEAKLSFNGNVNKYHGKIATIDVGGGSTEIVIGDEEEIDFIKSFPIGVVKITEMFFPNDKYDEESFLSANNYLKGFFNELSDFENLDFKAIGVAGTATTNVSVINKLSKFIESEIDGVTLSISDLENNLYKFASVDIEERKEILGLDAERADVIISGNLILLVILSTLNKKMLTVSTVDNLEGAIVLSI